MAFVLPHWAVCQILHLLKDYTSYEKRSPAIVHERPNSVLTEMDLTSESQDMILPGSLAIEKSALAEEGKECECELRTFIAVVSG